MRYVSARSEDARVPGGLGCPCRVYVCPGVVDAPGAMRRLGRCILQRRHIGQVAVALGEVEAIADRETIGDLEADEPDRKVHFTPVWLGQQRADVERSGVPSAQVA